MKSLMKNLIILAATIFAIAAMNPVWADPPKLTEAQGREMMEIVKRVNHATLPYKATVMEMMLNEADFFSDRLNLPVPRPIQIEDVMYPHVSPPWFGIIRETNSLHLPDTAFGIDIYNTNILRDQRLHALKFGVRGEFETTNFFFSFSDGKLLIIERQDKHEMERYADNLDALIGKPSLIDTNGAYQLATQWLASVEVDMKALKKLNWTVNQLHYSPRGTPNAVTLPLYYVDFGSKHHHWPQGSAMKDFDQPLIEVEILGTTKELQFLQLYDASYSRRPQMLITNALELIQLSNPPLRHFESSVAPETNSISDH
jgi:hypothetical protein